MAKEIGKKIMQFGLFTAVTPIAGTAINMVGSTAAIPAGIRGATQSILGTGLLSGAINLLKK